MGYTVTNYHSRWRLFSTRVKSAIVVVESGETAEQAWRRHVKKHPEDQLADIKNFFFIPQELR
jgi:hypothetical protein